MNILIHRRSLLPRTCRNLRLFRLACRKALGIRASRPGELNLIFTTNREIRRINKHYLEHDWNTDVVSFPYPQTVSAKLSPMSGPFGDVFVSVDQARVQARELGHSQLEELLTLVIHGTLHLMGYDDQSLKNRQRMFAEQDRILKILLPR